MAYEDVRLTLGVKKQATLSLAATETKMAMTVLVRRTSTLTVKPGASMSLRVVNEAI